MAARESADATSAGRLLVRSPYDDKVVGETEFQGPEAARSAIEAAAEAVGEDFPLHKRLDVLTRTAELIAASAEALAECITGETGKPITLARAEVTRAVSTFASASRAAVALEGREVRMDASPGTAKTSFTTRHPIGIVGAITPFNFPLNLAAHKVAPAIAAGCPVVLKPADKAPLAAESLARLLSQAGLPPDWLNVVVGPAPSIATVLLESDRVGLLSFTGSADIGWQLRRRAPRKRVTLELGNSTPVIVAPDADLDQACEAIIASAFNFAGQSCISAQRVYVQTEIFDAALERIIDGALRLGVGDPMDEGVTVGPVITEQARDRIMEQLASARRAGAKILTGGRNSGQVIEPTVVTGTTAEMSIGQNEIFGPVVAVEPYRELEEAIAWANATRYGLQASIFSADIDSCLTAAERLEFGAVLINESPSFRSDHMPYGGIKDSGNTKEGPLYAIKEMTHERLVVIER